MEISNDPYEQKLYHMFKSCDTTNRGTLDETALANLCNALELYDQAITLKRSLISNKDSRVSFNDFKVALLNLLGTEMDRTNRTEKSLVITDEVPDYMGSPPESSDREVSPKFVVGSKKYGRRSRPQSLVTDSSPSDSDEIQTISVAPNLNSFQTVQRSSSQSDVPVARRRRHSTGGTKLKRCASLPPQSHAKAKEQFNKKQFTTIQTPIQKSSSTESLDIPGQLETVPARSIIEMWERVNITDAKTLLSNLGFDDDEVNISMLSKVLDEELRGLDEESQNPLLKASVALQKTEITRLQQIFKHFADENKKLHADNKAVNQQAAMLAQEIDERHATLEAATKKEIQLMEQKHADTVRELTLQLATDKENWSKLNARLEARIKLFEQSEIKFKTEVQLLKKENTTLEEETTTLQKQIKDLLEKNIKMNKEMAEFDEKKRDEQGSKSDKENEEVLDLIEKVTVLQLENANLRDKTDELMTEVEGLNIELTRYKTKKSVKPIAIDATQSEGSNEDNENSLLGTKRRGDSPSKARTVEESPRLGKIRKCSNDDATGESETSGEWVALNSELNNTQNSVETPTTSGFSQDFSSIEGCKKDDEIKSFIEKIADLESQLKSLKESRSQENEDKRKVEGENYESRCRELETSLEQMRKAYEDCEDYWQAKLSEERQLFDNERQIYEVEQQESDKKFTELMEKVREYEEQFRKDGRLSPIEEKDALEQQYTDLEAEAEELRKNSTKMYGEKIKEIESLQVEIQELKTKLSELGECVEIKTESTKENLANSPISYLWNQSTIQNPAASCQEINSLNGQRNNRIVMGKPETVTSGSIYTTFPVQTEPLNLRTTVTPIQKPNSNEIKPAGATTATTVQSVIRSTSNCTNGTTNGNGGNEADDDGDDSSSASSKSYESHSVASTNSVRRQNRRELMDICQNSILMVEEIQRLRIYRVKLKDQLKDMELQRDSLVMELQQLQEAKPVLEKAYARASHPSLIQRVDQLELKNRHLQNVIKQQQTYIQSMMQQSWQQQHAEMADLCKRIESQGMFISEQTQRLANADVLVKDLYVENSHLTATIQRLEQQRSRFSIIQHQGLSGPLPGMP